MQTITFPLNKKIWGNGNFDMTLKFSKQFNVSINKNFGNDVPIFIRDEVLRTVEPYVPKLTGDLIKSAHENTTFDNEAIYFRWRTPYAVRQFYENQGKSGGRRGRLWTIRWLNDNNVANIAQGLRRQFGFGVR